MQSYQINGPLAEALHFIDRNLLAIAGILMIALVVSVVGELAKHHFSVKYESDRVKTIVKWLLAALSAGFTLLGYLIFFAQSNEGLLRQIPYIGQGWVEVLGTMWVLYNFRLNKTYKSITKKLQAWSDAKDSGQPTAAEPQPAPETQPAPVAAQTDSNPFA